jgi:hypothetical protein
MTLAPAFSALKSLSKIKTKRNAALHANLPISSRNTIKGGAAYCITE